jgi:hypothetical protein
MLGLMRRSRESMLIGALCGLLIGFAVSVGSGLIANCMGENVIKVVHYEKKVVPEQYMILLHATTWLIVGLGVGFGTGLGSISNRMGNALKSMLLCGIAGAAGGAIYPVVLTVAFPLVDSMATIPPDETLRVIWIAIPSALMGLVLGRKG